MTHELNRRGLAGTAASVAGATAPAPLVSACGGQVAQVDHVPFADRPGTTGFVVQNEAAIGPLPRPLLGLPRSSGRSVPEDASVLTLCPEQLAEQRAPALTAASGPTREPGRVAVDQMIHRLTAALRGERPRNEQALLTPTLTSRQSASTVCTRISVPEESS